MVKKASDDDFDANERDDVDEPAPVSINKTGVEYALGDGPIFKDNKIGQALTKKVEVTTEELVKQY